MRVPILSIRARQGLVRAAEKSGKTARAVLSETRVPVSLRTVQRILLNESHLEFGPLMPKLALTSDHIRERLR